MHVDIVVFRIDVVQCANVSDMHSVLNLDWLHSRSMPKDRLKALFICELAYFAENLNTVFCRNVSPSFRIVLGKSG